MPVPFPPLTPSAFRWEAPTYETVEHTAEDGAITMQILLDTPGQGMVELEFQNVKDTSFEAVLTAHDMAYGEWGQLTLPNELWQGRGAELRTLIENYNTKLQWAFAELPAAEWAKSGRCTVKVKLKHRIAPLALAPAAPAAPPPSTTLIPPDAGVPAVVDVTPILNCNLPVPPEPPPDKTAYLWVSELVPQGIYTATSRHATIVTSDQSVWRVGVYQDPSPAKFYALLKYNAYGTLLFAKRIDGLYESPDFTYAPAICEGKNGGVYVMTRGTGGIWYADVPDKWRRIWSFSATGQLLLSKTYRTNRPEAINGAGADDSPYAALYVASRDRLYITGTGMVVSAFNATTLDHVRTIPTNDTDGQGGWSNIFWREDIQRLTHAYRNYATSFRLREYSSDLLTQYQGYIYSINPVGASGVVYPGQWLMTGNGEIIFQYHYGALTGQYGRLGRLSSSEGGFTFGGIKTFGNFDAYDSFSGMFSPGLGILASSDIVYVCAGTLGDLRTGMIRGVRLSADLTQVLADVKMRWKGINYSSNMQYINGPGINPATEFFTFWGDYLSTGYCSFNMPQAPGALNVPGSTAPPGDLTYQGYAPFATTDSTDAVNRIAMSSNTLTPVTWRFLEMPEAWTVSDFLLTAQVILRTTRTP